MKKPVMTLYGNVQIPKAYCKICKAWSFVVDKRLVCCDIPLKDNKPKIFLRVSEPDCKRKRISEHLKKKILKEQNNLCFYCESYIYGFTHRHGKRIKLRLHFDHQVPYAYSQNNNTENIVASCHVCNGIKSSFCFQTVEEAVIYIMGKREEKGYNKPNRSNILPEVPVESF